MLSLIRLYDKVDMNQIGFFGSGFIAASNCNIVDELAPIFGIDNINDIESAFEGNWSDEATATESYIRKYKKPTERLRAIMLNVVKNKGVFKPTLQK